MNADAFLLGLSPVEEGRPPGAAATSPAPEVELVGPVGEGLAAPVRAQSSDERLSETKAEAGVRRRVARKAFRSPLALSAFAHAAAIAAIALLATGPFARAPIAETDVELVRQPPAAQSDAREAPAPAESAARPPAQTAARLPPKGGLLVKPPPEPGPARAAPHAKAAPRRMTASTSRASDNANSAVAPADADGQAAPSGRPGQTAIGADPDTALPFFSMPSSFTSSVLDGQGETGDSYKGLVFGRLARAKRFPPSAGARKESGQAIVAFTVDDTGALVSVSLAQSSGYPDLDAAALAMVREVAPFPPPPPGAVRSFAAAIAFGER